MGPLSERKEDREINLPEITQLVNERMDLGAGLEDTGQELLISKT